MEKETLGGKERVVVGEVDRAPEVSRIGEDQRVGKVAGEGEAEEVGRGE
jgi:hypothetical protein